MPSMDVTRKITLIAQSQGYAEAAAAAKALAAAQDDVAVAATSSERASQSSENAAKRIERTYDSAARASQDFAKELDRTGKAMQQGFTFGNVDSVLDGLFTKFQRLANPMDLQAQGFSKLATAVADYNLKLAAQADLAERAAQASAKAQTAAAYQQQINSNLGVRTPDQFNTAGRAADIEAYGKSLDAVRAKYVPLAAIEQQHKSNLSEIAAAAALGAISEHEAEQAVSAAVKTYEAQAAALHGVSDAHHGLDASGQAAFHSVRALGEQIAAGVPITQALASHISQLSFILGQEGGIAGAFGQLATKVRTIVGSMNPLYIAMSAVAAVGSGLYLAFNQASHSMQGFEGALTGLGRASGLTASQLQQVANQGSLAAGTSLSAASEMVAAFARTGNVGADAMLTLEKSVKGFALATGQTTEEARKDLIAMFADPGKAADTLNEKLHLFDASQTRAIKTMVAGGDAQRAAAIEAKALADRVAEAGKKADEAEGFFSKWFAIMGRGAGVIGQSFMGAVAPNDEQKLQQRLAALQNNRASYSNRSDDFKTRNEEEIRSTEGLIRSLGLLAQARKDVDDAKQAAENGMALIASINSEYAAYDKLINQQATLREAMKRPDLLKGMGPEVSQALLGIDAALARIGDRANAVAAANQQLAQTFQLTRDAMFATTVEERANIAAKQMALQLGDAVANTTRGQMQIEQARQAILDQSTAAVLTQTRAVEGQIAVTQQEIGAAGMIAGVKQQYIAALQKENDLKQQGVDVSSKSAQALIAEAAAAAGLQQALQVAEGAQAAIKSAEAAKYAADQTIIWQQAVANGNVTQQQATVNIQAATAAHQYEVQALEMATAAANARAGGNDKLAESYQKAADAARKAADDTKAAAQATGEAAKATTEAAAAQKDWEERQKAAHDWAVQSTASVYDTNKAYLASADAIRAAAAALQEWIRVNEAALASMSATDAFSKTDLYYPTSSPSFGGPTAITDANGKPVNSISFTPDAFYRAALLAQAQTLNTHPSTSTNNVASIGSSLQSLLSSLSSGATSGTSAANDNGNKQMPQLNAYAERSASIYYGTETGNYYTEGLQKQTDIQGQILSTNQQQLTSQTAAQAALEQIMAAANLMVQKNMTPQQVYGYVIGELQKIGYNKTAADMQAQLDTMTAAQASAFNTMQAGMLTTRAGMLSGGVGGVVDPNYVKPGTWATNPFAPALTDTFTGYHATGGTIPAGMWGIAGEAGPEVITGPAHVTPIPPRRSSNENMRPLNITQHITQYIQGDPEKVGRGLVSTATRNVGTRAMINGSTAA